MVSRDLEASAFDKDLHQRIGHSYAGNSFLIIRAALRRELLLALARLWDTNSAAVRMNKIAAELADPAILDALAAELRTDADEAFRIIRKYQEGGTGHGTLNVLLDLRHQRLAHRQLAE